MRSTSAALAVALLHWACGDDDRIARERDANAVTVMVVDEGIDPSLPVFAGKVIAGYTLTCAETADAGTSLLDPLSGAAASPDASAPDGGAPDGGPPVDLAAAKQAVLRELATPSDRCQLRPGLDAVGSPFGDLEAQRLEWNRMVRTDVSVIGFPLLETLSDRSEGFHGSSTAGIIAWENPKVRLVLVNRALASADEVAAMITCPSQAELDLATAVLQDEEVKRAYAFRPRGEGERALVQAAIDHGVQLMNESFGPISRHGLEKILRLLGCYDRDLGRYFAALNELEHLARGYLPAPRALVIRAAGNETARLDTTSDSLDCRPDRSLLTMVGSYGVVGEKSSFTNFGDCVDVFAPGEAVLGPLPGDWWLPRFGTSFAAPLVTRLLSMMEGPFDPQAARQALHALRRPDRSIPRPRFPEELLYLPGAKSPLALTVDDGERPTTITQVEMRELVWPLRLVQRTRR